MASSIGIWQIMNHFTCKIWIDKIWFRQFSHTSPLPPSMNLSIFLFINFNSSSISCNVLIISPKYTESAIVVSPILYLFFLLSVVSSGISLFVLDEESDWLFCIMYFFMASIVYPRDFRWKVLDVMTYQWVDHMRSYVESSFAATHHASITAVEKHGPAPKTLHFMLFVFKHQVLNLFL